MKIFTDIHDETINQWRKNSKKVVKTKAITSLLEKIDQNDVTVVTGLSGCGKSTAIHYAVLEIHDHERYDIIPAHFPNDLIQYYNTERRQVFVFDDCCGKYSIDLEIIKTWNNLTEAIITILNINLHKIHNNI